MNLASCLFLWVLSRCPSRNIRLVVLESKRCRGRKTRGRRITTIPDHWLTRAGEKKINSNGTRDFFFSLVSTNNWAIRITVERNARYLKRTSLVPLILYQTMDRPRRFDFMTRYLRKLIPRARFQKVCTSLKVVSRDAGTKPPLSARRTSSCLCQSGRCRSSVTR